MDKVFNPAASDEENKCPCCGRLYPKVYKRAMNSNIALTILRLYKHRKFDWTHIEDFLKENGYKRSGDFAKAQIFGLLIKKKGDKSDGNPNNGFYKLTGRGIAFATGALTVPKYAKIKDGEFLEFDGEEINIRQALGKAFNYDLEAQPVMPVDSMKPKLIVPHGNGKQSDLFGG